MYVTIPNAENHQVHRALFITAWKVWFKRFSGKDPDTWQEGHMPIGETDHGLAAMLDEGQRFSLEVICRLLVPWTFRNKKMADIAFLHVNHDLVRECTYELDNGESVPGVRLSDAAIDLWEELTYIEQDIFMIFAEAHIQADIESTSSDPIVIDDAGIDIIGEDIYPPLIPEKHDKQEAYVEALVEWIQEDPFQPLYHRQPHGNPVSGWDERLLATFWPKPRSSYMVISHLADPLLYRCNLLAKALYDGKTWDHEDEVLAVKTCTEIFMLYGLPQRVFTADDVKNVFIASVMEKVDSRAKMNSGWTKVAAYASAFLEDIEGGVPQVSWNSRVSASIVSRLDFLLVEAGHKSPKKLFPGIGIVEAWGGTRPREFSLKWPNAYRNWDAQHAASHFVVKIRDHLNNTVDEHGNKRYPEMPKAGKKSGLWTIRGIQQVLSADGY
ncbi:MAG: hypothetical protein KJO69_02100 [Gammaproteobacteria bacterium]|nr:hypothetical protein [Gammaproteobacteria bacterium]